MNTAAVIMGLLSMGYTVKRMGTDIHAEL